MTDTIFPQFALLTEGGKKLNIQQIQFFYVLFPTADEKVRLLSFNLVRFLPTHVLNIFRKKLKKRGFKMTS